MTQECYQAASAAFDQANAEEPNKEAAAGKEYPKELLYAQQYDEGRRIQIVRKTWQKMSPRAHEFALAGKIKLPEALAPPILKAAQ